MTTNLKAVLVVGTCLSGWLPSFAMAQSAQIDYRTPVSFPGDAGQGPASNRAPIGRLSLSEGGSVSGGSNEAAGGAGSQLTGVFDQGSSVTLSIGQSATGGGNSPTSAVVSNDVNPSAATSMPLANQTPVSGDPKANTVTLSVPAGRELQTGGQVVFGGVNLDTSTPNTLAIVQSTDKAITSWATFDIGSGYNVAIRQPNANSAMLARVRGDTPSLIVGQLSANGQIVLINPNGIAVGTGGRIDTGSFVASTLDIADADFLKGNLTFRRTGQAATVVNQGTINAATGVALVGSGVINEGAVSARLGRIGYGAGDLLTVDFAGDQFLSIAIPVSDAAGITDVSGRPLEALVQARASRAKSETDFRGTYALT